MDQSQHIRPYQLTGPRYALWFDVGRALGAHAQAAVGHFLCGGSRIEAAYGGRLDEMARSIVEGLAAERGVLIPPSVY